MKCRSIAGTLPVLWAVLASFGAMAAPPNRGLPAGARPTALASASSVRLAEAAPLWGKAYGGADSDHGFLVKQTGDGGFLLGGDTASFGAGQQDLLLLKADASGSVVWAKAYGTSGNEFGAILPLQGGGLLAQGTSVDLAQQATFFLVRLGEDGTVQWQKSYGPPGSGLTGALPTSDGGFLLNGFSLSFATLDSSLKMLRLDSSGNILWQKEYTGAGQVTGAFYEAQDGTILGSGTVFNLMTQDADLWAARFDASGNVLWQKTYGGSDLDAGGGLWPVPGGGYILSGTTRSFGAGGSSDGVGDVWLLRLDGDGDILWQKTYGGSQDEWGFVQPLQSGGFLLAADTDSFGAGDHDLWILKLDSDGGILWQRTYGGAGKDELSSAEALDDGGVLLAADTESFGHGLDDVWVLRLDSSGNPLFQRAYGGADREEGIVEALSGGGFFVSGETKSFGAGNSDLLALRLDGNGRIGASCSLISDTSVPGSVTAVAPGTSAAAIGSPGLVLGALALSSATMNLSAASPTPSAAGLCAHSSTLTAAASASPESGTAPLDVAFSASASGGTPPYSYAWTFGDGAASVQQNPLHTYASAGSYPVALTVTDGASDTATDSHLTIQVNAQGCSLACSAVVPATAETGQALTFSGSATAAGCSGSPSYEWDFGDGSAHAFTASPTHAYSAPGTYSWTLTVTTAGASPCTQTGSVTVTDPSGGCVLTCTASVPATATVWEVVTFNGTVTATDCSDTPTVDWDFGDGSAHGTALGVSHSYSTAGSYTWTLTVREGNGGDVCTQTGTLVVGTVAVTPPSVSSISKKGNPFRFVVAGSNFQSGIQVFIEGQPWTQIKWKNSGQVLLKGGASLKAAVPKNTPRAIRFLNPDGGEVTVNFQWP
ncbi:MAG: PKD domain-containing protein [Acidobacteriota bacterium]